MGIWCQLFTIRLGVFSPFVVFYWKSDSFHRNLNREVDDFTFALDAASAVVENLDSALHWHSRLVARIVSHLVLFSAFLDYRCLSSPLFFFFLLFISGDSPGPPYSTVWDELRSTPGYVKKRRLPSSLPFLAT